MGLLLWGLGNSQRVGQAYGIKPLNCHRNLLVKNTAGNIIIIMLLNGIPTKCFHCLPRLHLGGRTVTGDLRKISKQNTDKVYTNVFHQILPAANRTCHTNQHELDSTTQSNSVSDQNQLV